MKRPIRRLPLTIDKALETTILRYHFVEHWGVNTIARQLGIHHSAVDRVLSQAGLPKAERTRQASIVDPYHPMIIETLERFPRLTAARLYAMAQARGYTGGASQFRAHVAQLRPRKPSEAYLRLKTLPGEQAQVDWGHFGHVQIGRAKRPLMAFVMVLSFSRQIFLRFYLNQRMESFLRGHVAAFDAWGGVARVLLYDNLKSAALQTLALGQRLSRDRPGQVLLDNTSFVIKFVVLSLLLHTGFSCQSIIRKNRFGLYAISSRSPVNRPQSISVIRNVENLPRSFWRRLNLHCVRPAWA